MLRKSLLTLRSFFIFDNTYYKQNIISYFESRTLKKLIFISSFLLLLSSCNRSVEPVKVYSWAEYENVKLENPDKKIIVVDTICQFETKRAEKDLLKNKLVYCCRNYPERVVAELNLITKKYNIETIHSLSSCIRPPEGFTLYCYEKVMEKEIIKRHGEKWIDSLEKVAVKYYVIKHPNEPYLVDGIDLRTKYLK
jgi:hypothetical protein